MVFSENRNIHFRSFDTPSFTRFRRLFWSFRRKYLYSKELTNNSLLPFLPRISSETFHFDTLSRTITTSSSKQNPKWIFQRFFIFKTWRLRCQMNFYSAFSHEIIFRKDFAERILASGFPIFKPQKTIFNFRWQSRHLLVFHRNRDFFLLLKTAKGQKHKHSEKNVW